VKLAKLIKICVW